MWPEIVLSAEPVCNGTMLTSAAATSVLGFVKPGTEGPVAI